MSQPTTSRENPIKPPWIDRVLDKLQPLLRYGEYTVVVNGGKGVRLKLELCFNEDTEVERLKL